MYNLDEAARFAAARGGAPLFRLARAPTPAALPAEEAAAQSDAALAPEDFIERALIAPLRPRFEELRGVSGGMELARSLESPAAGRPGPVCAREMRPPRLLVIGRGVAGLAAAGRLASAGWAVALAGGLPAARIVTLDRSVAELLSLEYGSAVLRDCAPLLVRKRLLRWSAGTVEHTDDWLIVADLPRLAAAITARLPGGIEFLDAVPDASGFDYVIEATGRVQAAAARFGTPHRLCLDASRRCRRCRDRSRRRQRGSGMGIRRTGASGKAAGATGPPRRTPHRARGPASCRRDPAGFGDPADLAATPPAILDATPCFTDPVAGPGRLRAGDAAAASDPLAGDGVGRALRSAILAAATLLRAGRTATATAPSAIMRHGSRSPR